MSKKIAAFFLIFTNVFLASWFVLHNDIIYGYSGDIARDMYLLQQTVIKKIILIGAHSGGIPGLFHGPAWIYLNLPAFVLSNGNPIGVGWFWVFLTIIALVINYIISKKLFNSSTALLSSLLFSVFLIEPTKALINPFGAVLLFPLFFYFIYRYYQNTNVQDLLLSLFLVGCMIQFQVAFGAPILLLTLFLIGYKLKQTKKWNHVLAFGILAIPFSTYVLFEVRHDFLQIKSLYNYIVGTENFAKQPLNIILLSRIKGFFIDGLYIFRFIPLYMSIAMIAIFGYFCSKAHSSSSFKKIYALFIYFYTGYWVINLLYQGIIFDYYYWPFLPVVIMMFTSTYNVINKKLFIVLFSILYIFTLIQAYKSTVIFSQTYIGKNVGSWLFNKQLAEEIFANNDSEFGYFIFTPDLHATGTKYAMYYVQKLNTNKGYLNTKKKVTYIIFAPPLAGSEFNNGIWWKTDQVNIKRKPNATKLFPNGFRIEKYELTNKEIAIPTDPGLVNEFNL